MKGDFPQILLQIPYFHFLIYIESCIWGVDAGRYLVSDTKTKWSYAVSFIRSPDVIQIFMETFGKSTWRNKTDHNNWNISRAMVEYAGSNFGSEKYLNDFRLELKSLKYFSRRIIGPRLQVWVKIEFYFIHAFANGFLTF